MSRRGNGEGTIFKRNNGRWVGQVYVTQANGIPKRVSVSGKTQAVVKEKLKELQEQENSGLPYSDEEWKMVDYLKYWIEEVQPGRIRESTLANYRNIAKTYLYPVLAGYTLKTFSVANGRYVIGQLVKKGIGGASLQKCYQILHAMLNYAMKCELIMRNVMTLVEKPAYEQKETVIWTAKQAAHFLSIYKNHPQYIAFLLPLSRGMRRGEVLGLRYSDIDFEQGVILVRQQIYHVDGKTKAAVLKTKNSRRELPLTANIRQAIIKHAKRNGVVIPPFNPKLEISMEGTIVTSRVGTPLSPRNYARLFENLTQKAGLPRIKLHAMRHITATLTKDMPEKDAQLFFGHANISTTRDIYQHGTKSIQRASVAKLEKQLLKGQADGSKP